MKQITNEASNISEYTEELNNKDCRVFDYALNNKRVKSKLLKGAKRGKHLVVESKIGCVNLIFSDGSYHQTLLPLLRSWQQNEKFFINGTEVEIVEIDYGKDNNEKHVDTKLVILADSSRLVLHAYNSRQKLMVQGQNYETFALNCLEPFFKEKIDETIEQINKINGDIKESFRRKKDFKCPQCELVGNSNADLKVHIKTCHTNPCSSPPRQKVPKVLQEDLSITVLDEEEILGLETKATQCEQPAEECKWESCGYKAKDNNDLQKHFECEHMDYLRQKYLSNGIQDMVVGKQLSKDDEETSKFENEFIKDTNIEVITIPNCNACDFETRSCGDMEEHRRNGLVHNTEEPEIFLRESIIICGTCTKGFESETEFEKHSHTHVTMEVFVCENCKVTFNNAFDLRRHTKSEHGYMSKIVGEICPFCKLQSKDLDTLRTHILNIHARNPVTTENKEDEISTRNTDTCKKCTICPFIGTKIELESHNKSKHEKISICQECGKEFLDERALGDHIQYEHTHPKQVEPFPCQVCGLVFPGFTLLQNHLETYHKVEGLPCYLCKNKFENPECLQEHMVEVHPEVVMFYNMAQQVTIMFDKFEDVTASLNAIKQELFLVRTNQKVSEPVSTPHLRTTPPTKSTLPPPPPPPSSSSPPTVRTMKSSVRSEGPKVSFAEALKKSTGTESAPPKATSSPLRTPPSPLSTGADSRILFVGDSISSSVNIDALENALDKEVITAKAYCSVYDTEHNRAKFAAKFPKENFTDVIPDQLRRSEYHALVIQAGSVDISNLNTNQTSDENIEYFRQQTEHSAKNLFVAAENALKQQPSLKKVVVMKQTPRYDPLSSDPLSLKPALSELFNNILTEQWMSSTLKNKIVVGSHNLECSGAIQESRYRQSKSGRFDGVHLLGNSGPKFYTLSVLNILKKAQLTSPEYEYHQSCPQTLYQNRNFRNVRKAFKNKRPVYFEVPTNNRFSRLNEEYQGNW